MMRVVPTAVLVVGFLWLASACGSPEGGGIKASSPAVGANPGDSAALYLDLINEGDGDDALLGASCNCAEATSLHVTEDRNGVLLMLGTDRIEIRSGETTELNPGGSHIMLEGLGAPLQAGTTVQVTLEFSESGALGLEVPVVPLAELAERVPEQ